MVKRIFAAASCAALLVSLTACGSVPKQPAFDGSAVNSALSDTLIAENDKLRLEWDPLTKGVILVDLATGTKWGTTPVSNGEEEFDELGMPIRKHDMVNSPITVTCRNLAARGAEELYAYSGAVNEGVVRCARIENGLRVEYFFPQAQIMIPVNYILEDDYVSIRIDPTEIQEGDTRVTAVTVAPFWCSVKNDEEDSYLFVPSGSGALVDPSTISQQGARYSEAVFGRDYTMEDWYIATNTADIRLPVYGAKSGGAATCAIIDGGAESAVIEAVVGSQAYRYTAAYTTFRLRGYTQHIAEVFNDMNIDNIYAAQMIDTPVSIRLYPLTGEKANYSGMAEVYRRYLIEEHGLQPSGEQTRLHVNLVGGTQITRSFLGIPYTTLCTATTLNQAVQIVEELSESLGAFSVNLRGFGKSGVDIGSIAGGFGSGSGLGNAGDLRSLAKLCREKGNKLYMDFDLVRFSDGGDGFSALFDAASTAGGQTAVKYLTDKAVRDDVLSSAYHLLRPSQLEKAARQLSKKTGDWGLSGVTLSSLSTMAYSDYSDGGSPLYYSRAGFPEAAEAAIRAIRSEACEFVAADANAYAALLADAIIDAPTASSKEQIFMADVPFYGMVFTGYVPLASGSVNLAGDYDRAVLAAVESGFGVGYTLIASWDTQLILSEYPYFHSSLYSNEKERLIGLSNRLAAYYDKTKGAAIVSHSILDSGLRETVFDNGVTVYVNYCDTAVPGPGGLVPALDYLVSEGVA